MDDLVGRTLGNYRIVERIGRGGMASVYKAYQPALERYVAIKVIHSQLVEEDEGFIERFRREAKAVASLRHPNIVQVFDFGVEDDIYYMVMEFIQGTTLKARLNELVRRGQLMPLEEVVRIIKAVASGLEHAHQRGMIHRDIKPANIIITPQGEPIITDFGIAHIVGGTRLTATGAMIGTPAYMSPEQARGEPGDARSDIYSLGVVLYEMTTGRVPFDADTPLAILMKHLSDPLPLPRRVNPNLPEPVQEVILKALAKNPDDRYQSATALAQALERAIVAPALPRAPVPKPRPLPRPKKKRAISGLLMAGLGLVALVSLLIAGGLILLLTSGPKEAPTPTAVVQVTPTSTPMPSLPTATPLLPTPTSPPLPEEFLPPPAKVPFLYRSGGAKPVGHVANWKELATGGEQSELSEDPYGVFDQVVRLFVQGYGHGKQVARGMVEMMVPPEADVIAIPLATGVNGPVQETDSEAGVEIVVLNPQGDEVAKTFASHIWETELGVPYIYAFADVSPIRDQMAILEIRLRQPDVCAGSACTHDADLLIGELAFFALPDICTTQPDGHYLLYDYYDDPTPREVTSCAAPVPYFFIDVQEGPRNAYGAGKDAHKVRFELPEKAELLEFHLYYGCNVEGMTINGQALSPEQVYEAFPVRSCSYVNIAQPIRWAPVNNNPQAIAPWLRSGSNEIVVTVAAKNHWEERPFALFARFLAPTP